MITKINFLCAVIMCWVGNFIVYAQDSAVQNLPVVWNLQQCLDYSNLHNYALNTLWINKKTGEQNVLLSKAAVLPFVIDITTQTLTLGSNINSV